MELLTRASLNGYAVTAQIESGHGRVYGMEYGLVRFAKLLRPCPHYSNSIPKALRHINYVLINRIRY